MLTQYAFFYLMKQNSPKVPKLIPEHIKYWEINTPPGYTGGPFGDHSGGLILFKVENLEIANDLVNNDPFMSGNVIDKKWVKEWIQK